MGAGSIESSRRVPRLARPGQAVALANERVRTAAARSRAASARSLVGQMTTKSSQKRTNTPSRRPARFHLVATRRAASFGAAQPLGVHSCYRREPHGIQVRRGDATGTIIKELPGHGAPTVTPGAPPPIRTGPNCESHRGASCRRRSIRGLERHRLGPAGLQGSMRRTPRSLKCRKLRVATGAFRARAIPAI